MTSGSSLPKKLIAAKFIVYAVVIVLSHAKLTRAFGVVVTLM